MKSFSTLLRNTLALSAFLLGGALALFAQTPGVPYQAYIIDTNAGYVPGAQIENIPLANSKILLQFEIRNSKGVVEYVEQIPASTDKFGMVHTIVGMGYGKTILGDFRSINWDGKQKTMNIDIDFTSKGSQFQDHGTTELVYVPGPNGGGSIESITTLLDHGDGSYTYTSEDGTKTNIIGSRRGIGDPNSNGITGRAGDVYIDESTGDVYTYDGRTWIAHGGGNVISFATPPSPAKEGDVWFNTTDNNTYIYDGNSWLPVNNTSKMGSGDPNGGGGTTGKSGDIYVDNSTDDVYIYDGSKWIKIGGGSVTSAATAPSPSKEGDVWFNTTDKNTYIYDGSSWLPIDDQDATEVAVTDGTVDINGDGTPDNNVTVQQALENLDKAVQANETTSTLTNNNDGTYTYKDEDGTTTTFDITRSGSGVPTTTTAPNPSVGDVYVDESTGDLYVYDGTTWTKVGGGSVTSAATAPTSAKEGDVWFNTTDKNTYIYDGSSWLPVDDQDASEVAVTDNTIDIDGDGNNDSGVTVQQALENIDKLETTSTLTNNNDGTYTYKDEDGTTTTFDITRSGTGDPNGNGTTGQVGDVYVDESTGDFNLYLQNNAFFSIGTNQNGSLRVGKRQVVNSLPQYSGGGLITVRPTTTGGINNGYLHYSFGNGNGTAATGENRFYDTAFIFYTRTDNARQDIYVTEMSGCKIKGVQQGADHNDKYVVLRVQQGGRFDDNVVSDIKQFEFHATTANPLVSFARNKFTNLIEGFISFSTGLLVPVENPNFLGTWDRLGMTNNGGVNFIDPYIDNVEATEAQLEAKTLRAQAGGDETVKGIHISKSHREKLIDLNGSAITSGIAVTFINSDNSTVFTPTLTNGEYRQIIKLKRNTNTVTHPNWGAGVWKNYYPIKKFVYGYGYQFYGEEFTGYDDFKGIGVASVANKIIQEDTNISETAKATVDAYTEIDDLDKLYDRAKSWKVDSGNVEHPSINALLISASGATLDLDDHDLVIDASAASAFAVDKTNKKITIKAATLAMGNTFTAIKTTGTISTANGATIEFGYEDSTGKNKFVHLDWGDNVAQNVTVTNLDNSNALINNVSATKTYKGHFVMPSPAPTNGIRVEVKTPAGYTVFQDTFPEDDLNFIRLDVTLTASEERQIEMLFLARKILQKSEGINEALTGTTPSITDNSTTTNTTSNATNENQVAILQLLQTVLNKVSANREAMQNE